MPSRRSSRKAQRQSRRAEGQGGRAEPRARPDQTADEDAVHLQDPRNIRALAHPARMAIIDALASGDELTATECAELTGLTPSATAYHLKLLERYDFAEPAAARNDGRERPWRATDRRTLVDLSSSTPAQAAAATAVTLAFIDRTRALAQAFVATERQEPAEWQEVAFLGNADLWLTADETREVTAGLLTILEPYPTRTLPDRPASTRPVRIMNTVFPHPNH